MSLPTKASPLSLVVGALVDLITVAAVPADPEIKDSSAAYPGRSCSSSDNAAITVATSSSVEDSLHWYCCMDRGHWMYLRSAPNNNRFHHIPLRRYR